MLMVPQPIRRMHRRCSAQPTLSALLPQAYTHHIKIGEGTYGTVFKCSLVDQPTQVVAIKAFKDSDLSDKQVLKTSLREVSMLQSFDHPNILSLLQVFRHHSKLCLVTEYVNGTGAVQLRLWSSTLAGGMPACRLTPLILTRSTPIDLQS